MIVFPLNYLDDYNMQRVSIRSEHVTTAFGVTRRLQNAQYHIKYNVIGDYYYLPLTYFRDRSHFVNNKLIRQSLVKDFADLRTVDRRFSFPFSDSKRYDLKLFIMK